MTVAQHRHLTEYLALMESKLPGSTLVGAYSAGMLCTWAFEHDFLPSEADVDRMLNCQSLEKAREIIEILDAMRSK